MAGIALPAALAAAPIVLILLLMLGLRWSAAHAGLAALALAALLAVTAFDFGTTAAAGAQAGGWHDAVGVAAEGGFLALTILWILWPALALHRLQENSGAIATLRSGLGRLSDAPARQALLVGWLLALFFEGAAGFGTPVALAAPLLVGLGFAPVQAVVLALLGHAAGVSFGALGTPVAAQVALTGLGAVEIARTTALLHAALGGVLMLFFVRTLAANGASPGFGWPALAALGFFVPSLALAAWLGPELATLGGALIGALVFVAALSRANRRPVAAGPGDSAASGELVRAISPYLVLVVLVVATRAIAPLAALLGEAALSWQLFDRYQGKMSPLTHPGTLLMAALLIGARLQRVALQDVGSALAHAARQLRPVTVALLAMLLLSRLMLHGGLIDALERGAVAGIGSAWPWIAPAVGALGSFVTGSATASNVLLTTLQAQTAQALALPSVVIVAAQGFGAAVGNIICPHNIVAGAATVGLAGREGEILRRTLLPCLLYLALGGAAVAGLVALSW
ncbi:L-lactate permease [Piscinibacter sakaiensis]|uniref:L-lactate permease n=1 Tax=Piscinibacter sakaiensis TaxID=1547922 RepID=UPI003AB09B96